VTETQRVREAGARQARAERILDAAGALLLRWGYDKVTIEDVASHAGVGKGTVYLHWKTREELFVGVLEREAAAACEELIDGMRADPAETLLDRVTGNLYLAVMRRPLGRALFTADLEVLGKLARLTETALQAQGTPIIAGYLRLLQERGLVRGDLTVAELYYAHDATMNGFFLTESSSEHTGLTLERKAALLAGMVRLGLGAPAAADPGLVAEVAPRVIEIFQRLADITLAHLRRAYEERR
jgi:AcrR family transcriptional regulator